MINTQNIRNTIQRSPKLWFNSKTNVIQHINGIKHSYSIERDCIVDYENKIAKIVEKNYQEGYEQVINTYYKDLEKIIKIEGANNLPESLKTIKIGKEEFETLFSENGKLRPIPFDLLVQIKNESNIPNALNFRLLSNNTDLNIDKEVKSNVIISLCSDNTLKMNLLSFQLVDENNSSLITTNTELILHLYEGEVMFSL